MKHLAYILALGFCLAACGATTTPPSSNQILLNIPDRNWDPNSPDKKVGWCIETCIQMAAAYYGTEIPQGEINQAGRPRHHDLYFEDIDRALAKLQISATPWPGNNRDLDQYFAWIQQQLKERRPILCGVKTTPDEHPDWAWDHAVLVVGSNDKGLYINTNVEGQKFYTYDQLRNANNTYTFHNKFRFYFARAITGVASQRPIVGAIRWDAWYGQDDTVSQVERSLSPQHYHYRLPFFAKVEGENKVHINGDSPEVMQKELAYAHQAGLNYFAFVNYPDHPTLSLGLKRYLEAKDKNGIKFCLIDEGSAMDKLGTTGWSKHLQQLIEHFQRTDYQKVLDGRPLYFVFQTPKKIGRREFDALSKASIDAGLKRPYMVLMRWDPVRDYQTAKELGMDAVSSYAATNSPSSRPWPYAKVTEFVRKQYWEPCRKNKIPMVTFASTGWDMRPRVEHPVQWIKVDPAESQKLSHMDLHLPDASTATPQQLADHVKDAVQWTMKNRDINPANAVIIYAWNENDEGGWLIPTLKPDGSPDTRRIEELGKVLR